MSKQVYILYHTVPVVNPDPTSINLLFEMLRMLRICSRFGIWASRTSAPILRCVGSWIRQVKSCQSCRCSHDCDDLQLMNVDEFWSMLRMYDDVGILCALRNCGTLRPVFFLLGAFTLTASLYFWKVVQKNQKRHPRKKHWCMVDVTTWRYVCLSPGVAIWTSLAFRPIFSWAVLSMARLIS